MSPPCYADPPSLLASIQAGCGSCVALIGAGGKTTTMLRLASEIVGRGGTALVTTTTKIWPPAAMPLVLDAIETERDVTLRQALLAQRVMALADHRNAEGKLVGVRPSRVCALHGSQAADLILCEADGAAGRSLKSHRAGEPVIPECVTHVLVLAGLDALHQPVSPTWVHRVPEFCRVTGAAEGEAVSPVHVARALAAGAGFAPPAAQVWFVLTKVDGAERVEGARAVTDELVALAPGGSIITLSSSVPPRDRSAGIS